MGEDPGAQCPASWRRHPRLCRLRRTSQLREAIAEYLGVARGVDCRPQQVIVVTGAQSALDLVSRILMDEGDCVWMEEPGYLGARSAFLGGGGKLCADSGEPRRLGLCGSRPAAAPSHLCHAIVPMAARRCHAIG